MTSAVERVKRVMQEIVTAETGPNRLNAFISYQYESAVSAAQLIDSAVAGGEHFDLAGTPIAIKDNICTLDRPPHARRGCYRIIAHHSRQRLSSVCAQPAPS
jgi:Asp-tRNA(Asn)/Glu-tRNA(Gln) amidotransferase A subunit family amidase